MKNKKLIFTLPLVLTLGLAACGGKKDDNPPATDWSKAVKTKMTESIGEVLPFASLDSASIYFDGGYDVEDGEGWFGIRDENKTNVLTGYGSKLESAGFVASNVQGQSYYAKQTEEYSLYVMFSWLDDQPATEESEAVPAGNMIYANRFDASEETLLPLEDLEEFFKGYGYEDILVPDYESEEGSCEVLAAGVDSQSGQPFVTLGIDDSSHDEMDAYAEDLTAAGWDLEKDSYNDWGGEFGDTGVEVYLADFIGYSGYDCIILQFSLPKPAITEWPSDFVEEVLEYYGSEAEVPAFEGASDYETSYSYIGIWCTTEDTEAPAAYAAVLEGAGWEVTGPDDNGYYTATAPTGDLELYFGYYVSGGTLDIYFRQPLPTEWPSDFVEEVLEYFESEAEVPAFEGATTYEADYDYIGIWCETEDTEAAAAYAAVLEEAGWEVTGPDDEGYYTATAPTGDLELYFGYYAKGGTLDIYFGQPSLKEWPTDEVAAILEFFEADENVVLPAYEGGSAYELNTDYLEWLGVAIVYVTVDADSLEGYAALLEEYAWTVSYDETEDQYTAVSADETVQVTMYYSEDYGQVLLVISGYIAPITGWPAEDVAAIVANIAGEESSTVLPAFDDATDYEVYSTQVWCTTEDTESDAAYAAVLEAAGWTVTPYGEDDGYTAISPAEDLMLYVYYDTDYGQLGIFFYSYSAE